VGLPRPLVAEVRRLDESQLRHLLILARGLLIDSEVPVIEIADVPGMPTVRYRQRHVSCGKAGCGGCPHGPYWYAHWTEDGRRRSSYIGAELPGQVRLKLEALDAERRGRGPAELDPADPRTADALAGVGREGQQDDHAVAASGNANPSTGSPSGRGLRLVRDVGDQ
jgi:hypothetical protein